MTECAYRYMLLTQLITCCFSTLSVAWYSWKRIRSAACWQTMMAMLVMVVPAAGVIGVVPGLA